MRFSLFTGIASLLLLTACYHPPYNNFKPYSPVYKETAKGAAVGAVLGSAGVAATSTLIGTGVGALAFGGKAAISTSPESLIEYLQKRGDIKFEHYGETMLLIVPTDRYFLFNSAQLNELCYHALIRMAMLLRCYPKRVVYVAGFTDNIGSSYHKKMLTQARAEAMVAFLWANGIRAKCLHPEGYGDKHAVSDNHYIHGSAHNRRLEIEWTAAPPLKEEHSFGPMK